MVRDAIGNSVPGERKRPFRQKPKLMPVTHFIDGNVESERKVRANAWFWCRSPGDRRELELAESTLRRYLRQRKPQLAGSATRFVFPKGMPGQEGQLHW